MYNEDWYVDDVSRSMNFVNIVYCCFIVLNRYHYTTNNLSLITKIYDILGNSHLHAHCDRKGVDR